jgi:hypothetical protein
MGFAKTSKVRVVEPKIRAITNRLYVIDDLGGFHETLRFAKAAERLHLQMLNSNLLPSSVITAFRRGASIFIVAVLRLSFCRQTFAVEPRRKRRHSFS